MDHEQGEVHENIAEQCGFNTEQTEVPVQIPAQAPLLLRSIYILLDRDRHRDVLSWSADGLSFEIRNFDRVLEVMRYQELEWDRGEFNKKMRKYGFVVTFNRFTHPNFTKDKPEELANIPEVRKIKRQLDNILRKRSRDAAAFGN